MLLPHNWLPRNVCATFWVRSGAGRKEPPVRAAWYEQQGSPRESLVVGEMPDPVPGDGEVRIALTVSGMSPGDMKKRAGWPGSPMTFPRVIPHSDGAGTI